MIFLIEGGVLGLCGGLLGLGLAYLVSFPGDSIARSIMEPADSDAREGKPLLLPALADTGHARPGYLDHNPGRRLPGPPRLGRRPDHLAAPRMK